MYIQKNLYIYIKVMGGLNPQPLLATPIPVTIYGRYGDDPGGFSYDFRRKPILFGGFRPVIHEVNVGDRQLYLRQINIYNRRLTVNF